MLSRGSKGTIRNKKDNSFKVKKNDNKMIMLVLQNSCLIKLRSPFTYQKPLPDVLWFADYDILATGF